MKRVIWLLGWAVPEAWFAAQARAFTPMAEQVFIVAKPGWSEAITALRINESDTVVGYSLGALLLLQTPEMVRTAGQVRLLAPMGGFVREMGRGGRVSRAQLRQLQRWLVRDAAAAVGDFYARAGLVGAVAVAGEAELSWGLEQLAQSVAPEAWPETWRGWIGADDPLLEAEQVAASWPQVRIVMGVGHAPDRLIAAMVREVGW